MRDYTPIPIRRRFREEAMRVEASRECADAMESWSSGSVLPSSSLGGSGGLRSLRVSVLPSAAAGERAYAVQGEWVIRVGPDRYSVLSDDEYRDTYERDPG